ncbi:hypothetical protein J0A67_04775 [Algoriphagus aestuariicola]|uniref:Uncharacterized protein n=1 Tax=Algoriphagus aestuariicola TaxID=1852016 RepID=A0ABS3BLK5_9BACT|nr:hypothetical protein [Algoriphagus aestuariicola]MBN7800162.1 hypothetical protein [Algoriphagus aestuariicola]
MNLLNEVKFRATAPTPPFFQFLKKAGLLIAAIGTAMLTAPGEVPDILLAYAGHAVTAGTILVSICQLTVDESKLEEKLLQAVK